MEEKKRILVVDDDTSILSAFKGILEKAGYNVETAETGEEALRLLSIAKFDLCLVDVRLPDMDGTELLLEMAESPETVKIIITGFSSEKVGIKAADYGADDFLVKPVRAEELLAVIRQRLEVVQAKS
ncbi:MAG TPA: response regulator [Candidatus Acidoferrales bacterium]|nr:response regulator [Candidatus Acidoferrales bacterium]